MSITTAPTEAPADPDHLTTTELEHGVEEVRSSPSQQGRIEMIVARPDTNARDVLETGTFTTHEGLVGDNWRRRGGGDNANVEAQLTLINARYLDLVSRGDRERWPWAGDQVVVDLDLSTENLQPGDQLRLGTALIEVTAKPHRGCIKFVRRFGVDAQRFGNGPVGSKLRLRGIYVRVIEDGTASPGDPITKLA